MLNKYFFIICFTLFSTITFGQSNSFDRLQFLIGEWNGSGTGFGNNQSKIEASFRLVMNETYIEVKNESWFEPTKKNPNGEHHIDNGFISYDTSRNLIVFRQFNSEGFVNQYILNDSLSKDNKLVFETETIENFIPGGKAKWTINKISDNQIESIFDVYFPNKGYSCLGTNTLLKQK